MTQQEIKANLPQLPYWIENRKDLDLRYIKCDEGNIVFTVDTDCYSMDLAISEATISAINNTYGKGINPESVPDMYNALQTIDEILHAETMGEVSKIIKDILKNATK